MENIYKCNYCLDTGVEAIPSPDDVDFEPCNNCETIHFVDFRDAKEELIKRTDSLGLETLLSEDFARRFSI